MKQSEPVTIVPKDSQIRVTGAFEGPFSRLHVVVEGTSCLRCRWLAVFRRLDVRGNVHDFVADRRFDDHRWHHVRIANCQLCITRCCSCLQLQPELLERLQHAHFDQQLAPALFGDRDSRRRGQRWLWPASELRFKLQHSCAAATATAAAEFRRARCHGVVWAALRFCCRLGFRASCPVVVICVTVQFVLQPLRFRLPSDFWTFLFAKFDLTTTRDETLAN